MKTRKNQSSQEVTPLQAQVFALGHAMRSGVIVKANIQGTLRELISIKCDDEGKITFLFHDDEGRLCLFKATPGQKLEFIVNVEGEVTK